MSEWPDPKPLGSPVAKDLTLPEEAFNYLVFFATLRKLGRTENEVASRILVHEAYAMHQRGFHEQRIPAADQTRSRICEADCCNVGRALTTARRCN